MHQQVIWVKARGVPTYSLYLWKHEPCMVGWVEGFKPKLKPPSDATSVWHIDQRFEQLRHPSRPRNRWSCLSVPSSTTPRSGEIVYEPFSGSGTQIIAAERTGRVCYAVEKEPSYVDVAVKRWEAFTDQQATRETGQRDESGGQNS